LESTIDINRSSLVSVEEIEGDLANDDLLLRNAVFSIGFGIEGSLLRGFGGFDRLG
jgi:hypothetical protein